MPSKLCYQRSDRNGGPTPELGGAKAGADIAAKTQSLTQTVTYGWMIKPDNIIRLELVSIVKLLIIQF